MKKKLYYGHLAKVNRGEKVNLASVSVESYLAGKRIVIDCNEPYTELVEQFKQPIEMLGRQIWEETKANELFSFGFHLREEGIAFEISTDLDFSNKIQVSLRKIAEDVSKQIDRDLKKLA